ncbi:MAG: GNAT family N-acetyltransferase [Motiliproteus sp.]|nr:GNAT family N-acetyltransferase [Motiliproteus sp.]
MNNLQWQTKSFNQLSIHELYQILKLRVDIFVVEQCCPYPELDDKDRDEQTLHLFAVSGDQIVAYSRLLPPGCSFPEASIGRVVIAPNYRGKDIGRTLMAESMKQVRSQWQGTDICIGAQARLTNFYKSLGFKEISDHYMEDGIEHVNMLAAAID